MAELPLLPQKHLAARLLTTPGVSRKEFETKNPRSELETIQLLSKNISPDISNFILFLCQHAGVSVSAQAETACHPHPSAGKRPAIHSPSTTALTSPPLRLPAACLPPALPAPCLPLQAQGVISAPPPCRNTRYFHLCHLTQDHFSPPKKEVS